MAHDDATAVLSVSIGTMNFLTRRSLYKGSLLSFLNAQPNLCLLTEIPGNIGDHLIWAGTVDLLSHARIRYTPIPLLQLEGQERIGSTLLIPGSGALTKSYHEWLPATILKASRHFHKVIILPSGFDPTVPIVADCLSPQNVFALARETNSYRSIKTLGHAALCLDCAIFYSKFDNFLGFTGQSSGDGILLALREDKDSLLGSQGLAPNPLINQDISLTKNNLGEWIEAIISHQTVVTDRLHVAVACVLLGKKLIYLDPDNKKISIYFDFTFRNAFGDRIRQCSFTWLLERKFAVRKTSS